MSRRMSCSMTVDAVRERRKTVTRRHADTWRTLKPSDQLTLIEKGMGLPKGAKQVVLAEVEVTSVSIEPLGRLGYEDLRREGFPGMARIDFMVMWLESHGHNPRSMTSAEIISTPVRRIEWRYLG